MRCRHRAWFGVGVAIWAGAPLALVLCLTWVSINLSVAGKQQPTWVKADPAGNAASRQVEVGITWSDPVPVLAPSWSGTVRDVMVAPGSIVKSGDPIVRVDAVTRIAWHSAEPFYRDLALGDTGDDVAALNLLLAELGFSGGNGDRFTTATSGGVAQLAVKLGAGRNQVVFSASWIVYIPEHEMEVGSVSVAKSGLAPSVGSLVFTGLPIAVRAQLLSGGIGSISNGIHGIQAIPDEKLIIGEEVIPLNDDRETLSETGLMALSRAVDSDSKTVVGKLERALVDGAVEIPAAAVHTDPDAVNCVRVLREDRSVGVVRVSVVSGASGRATVFGNLAPRERVGIPALDPGSPCG